MSPSNRETNAVFSPLFERKLNEIRAFYEIFVLPDHQILLTTEPIELKPNQKEREEAVLTRLKALIGHARRTPFYSSYLPVELTSWDDFFNIPIISKRDLIAHQEEMLVPLPQRGMQDYLTSGTSGVHVKNIRNSIELKPHFARAARFFLYAIDDPTREKFLNFLYYGGRWSGGIGAHSIMQEGLLNFVPIGAIEDINQLIKDWNQTQPTGAFVSPPWFVYLTRKLEERGFLSQIPSLLTRIFYLGEKFTSSQIEYVTGRTISPGAFIHSIYATTEAGMIGLQVFPNGPIFIVPDAAVIEIVDPESNQPLPIGTTGNIVVTSLNRLMQPLIRYNTEDEGRIIPEEELMEYRQIGFYAPAIELKGRISDDFKIGDGFIQAEKLVSKLVSSLNPQPFVLEYQIKVLPIKGGKTEIRLTIESTVEQKVEVEISPETIASILEEFSIPQDFTWGSLSLLLELVPAGTIKRVGPAGKVRHLIDER